MIGNRSGFPRHTDAQAAFGSPDSRSFSADAGTYEAASFMWPGWLDRAAGGYELARFYWPERWEYPNASAWIPPGQGTDETLPRQYEALAVRVAIARSTPMQHSIGFTAVNYDVFGGGGRPFSLDGSYAARLPAARVSVALATENLVQISDTRPPPETLWWRADLAASWETPPLDIGGYGDPFHVTLGAAIGIGARRQEGDYRSTVAGYAIDGSRPLDYGVCLEATVLHTLVLRAGLEFYRMSRIGHGAWGIGLTLFNHVSADLCICDEAIGGSEERPQVRWALTLTDVWHWRRSDLHWWLGLR